MWLFVRVHWIVFLNIFEDQLHYLINLVHWRFGALCGVYKIIILPWFGVSYTAGSLTFFNSISYNYFLIKLSMYFYAPPLVLQYLFSFLPGIVSFFQSCGDSSKQSGSELLLMSWVYRVSFIMQQSFCYQLQQPSRLVCDCGINYGNIWNVFLFNVEELQPFHPLWFKLCM